MGEPLESNRLDRRAFLLGSGLAVSALAGCLEDDPEAETESSGNGNGDGDENGDEDDENGESGGGGSGRSAPTVPDPDFTVGPSDEADYETLQAAYDALESGDVIGIEPGRYTVQPSIVRADEEGEELTKTYTYVGEAATETTIEILMPEDPSFSVDGLLHYHPDDGAPGFWQATVDIPSSIEFARLEEYEDDYDSGRVDAHYATVNGSFDGPTEAYDTVFADDVSHALVPAECEFHGDVGGPVISARHCQFYSDLNSRGGYTTDSVIEGTVGLNQMRVARCEIHGGVTVNGGGSVENCIVDPKPSSSVAVDIRSRYDATVVESEIRGTVRSNRDGSYIDRIEQNTFDAPSGTSYIIDGAPATDIYLNAFLGGDVRITTDTGDLASFPADELTLYDAERELGNYYSEWEQTDTEDEGVLSTRTLPGEDGEMDRHPLANSDIDAYAAAAEEDEEDDD
ncbi:hypothetical protein ACLI4Z_06395 [Natrialbaceae archaeon A-arb3/5]